MSNNGWSIFAFALTMNYMYIPCTQLYYRRTVGIKMLEKLIIMITVSVQLGIHVHDVLVHVLEASSCAGVSIQAGVQLHVMFAHFVWTGTVILNQFRQGIESVESASPHKLMLIWVWRMPRRPGRD